MIDKVDRATAQKDAGSCQRLKNIRSSSKSSDGSGICVEVLDSRQPRVICPAMPATSSQSNGTRTSQ